jgi:hypothetical protein
VPWGDELAFTLQERSRSPEGHGNSWFVNGQRLHRFDVQWVAQSVGDEQPVSR